ncbi:hypothetical protein RvY_12495 [Ramazzottius varieornatus]|uniref:Uncharacterized protein n=1 Tax=Ramazzottius varieornatus TaxID=947166 RepID=A0A1D1VLN3_RAMVA|nr:hypothetical protein RvY_12495 [Ramazzottius varieornatus]
MVLNRRQNKAEHTAQLDIVQGTIPVETVKVELPLDKSARPKKAKAGRTTPKAVVIEETEKPAVLQVERIDRKTAAISFTYPLTAYVAFALSMSLLDGKAADDYVLQEKDSGEVFDGQLGLFGVVGLDFDHQEPIVTGKMVDALLKPNLH